MATSNIANTTGLSMNRVDERNTSSQSRRALDVTAWAQSLLDAAQSLGDGASLASKSSGDCGAAVLNVRNKVVPLGAIGYEESQKYDLDSAKPISGQVSGTLHGLSPEARTLAQQKQLAALERAKASAQNEDDQTQIQALIDQLKAIWATQSASPQSESGEPVASAQVQVAVSSDSAATTFEQAAQQSEAQTSVVDGAAPLIGKSIDGGDSYELARDGDPASAEKVQSDNSACPSQALPAEILSSDPSMQAWYESILAAAREIDPNATIDNSIGIARVLVNGKQTILTGPMYDEFAQGYATPEQQVNRGVTGTPIAWTSDQQLRLAQHHVQALNSSFSDLSPADAQKQFDAMRPSMNGVPGEVSLSIGSERFPIALQDGKIVLNGPPESWAAITGNPPPAGSSSTAGPRLVTQLDGKQGYVGPDGTTWRDTSTTTSAWGTKPTPFDGPATRPAA
jgi:hypothetical protein